MKFGFSTTWDDLNHLEKLLPVIAEVGFDGVEPTFIKGKLPSPEGFARESEMLKAFAGNYGLSIPSMRGGKVFWSTIAHEEESVRELGVEHARKGLEAVSIMGGDLLLVVPGELNSAVPYETHWKRVVDFARIAGDIAASKGMHIGLENTEAGFPANLSDWKQLLQEINHAHVGMYLDIGNIVWLDLGDPAQWIKELAPWIKRIHFKDGCRGERLVQLLEGEVDWPLVMAALRSIEWDDWIIAEPDWYRWAPEVVPKHVKASLDAIRQL
ncbi:MAG: sugar phosphate isomerase/epimerase [Spirochaetia bacterium]|nr:sugar phosphate isomerase/epimerase [Spirochaetia bacterium]